MNPCSPYLLLMCLTWCVCIVHRSQGKFCAHYPKVTMLVALLLVAWACLGLLYVNVVTSPQKIWVPPNSPTNLQQVCVAFVLLW